MFCIGDRVRIIHQEYFGCTGTITELPRTYSRVKYDQKMLNFSDGLYMAEELELINPKDIKDIVEYVQLRLTGRL